MGGGGGAPEEGTGGGVGADDVGSGGGGGADDVGSGGGGADDAGRGGGAGDVGADEVDLSSSKELIEFTEFDFKCDDFFGLFGGILGGTFKPGLEPESETFNTGGGGGAEGTGGAETDGIDGTDGFCSACLLGLEDGIGGATCGMLTCGRDFGTSGDAPEGIGILV